MILAKVIGTMTATLKHPRLEGRTFLLIQPLGEDLKPAGTPFLAVDTVGAGEGQTVLAVREGGSALIAAGDLQAPIHAAILGIVDAVGDRVVS